MKQASFQPLWLIFAAGPKGGRVRWDQFDLLSKRSNVFNSNCFAELDWIRWIVFGETISYR